MNVAGFLSRLRRVRRSGDGWTALCPAHEDKSPSLSITDKEGKVLVHCHAGCPPKRVVEAMGLKMKDLNNGGGKDPQIVATYDYRDENDVLLFQVVRFSPKVFKQRRPDGQGRWTWNLKDVRRVLYNLPEVLGAENVLITEGEKDANTGTKLGFVTTCNPGGAGKWKPEYSEMLAGKDVTVIADADKQGREHAATVAKSLEGKVRSAIVIELPAAKDLTEWIERGGTCEKLTQIIQNAAEASRVSIETTRSDSDADLVAAIRDAALAVGTPLFDKRRNVARLVMNGLSERGSFLRTNDSRAFFFQKKERRLYDVSQTPFQHLLTQISGLGATENLFRFTLDILQASANREAQLVEVHTFSYFNIDSGLLALSDGSSGMWVRERGGRWERGRNGDGGLLFLIDPNSTAWEPEFSCDGHSVWFLRQFLFAEAPMTAEDSRTLMYVWLLQQLFPPLRRTRMVPAFLGPQGSGKTTAERLVGHLLLGPGFDVTGLQREREDAFIAAITNRTVLGLDNADSKIPFLPDALARYATGQRYQLRRLYTTNEEASFSPRAILLISSRDPRFNRPDVAERLLPFYFDRPVVYRPEFEIFAELEKRRGAVMGSLLLKAGMIADALSEHPAKALPFRMADFASFGERVFASLGKSSDWIELLGRLEKAQAEFASEGDGLVDALRVFLRHARVEKMPVGELFKKCAGLAESHGFIFPRSCQSFGQRLSSMRRVLEIELGVQFQESRGHGRARTVSLIPRDGYAGDAGDAYTQRVYEKVEP